MNIFDLTIIAKRAAERAVAGQGNLNDNLTKMASDRALNPLQIARVVELANHEANTHYRLNSEEGTYTFPLADSKTILSNLSASAPGVEKVASQQIVNKSAKINSVLAKYASSGPDALDTFIEQSGQEVLKAKVDSRLESLESALTGMAQDLELERVQYLRNIEGQMDKTAQLIQNGIINGEYTWPELQKFASAAKMEFAPVLLLGVEHILASKGNASLTKQANAFLSSPPKEADSDYGVVINPDSEMYTHFDSANKDMSKVDRLNAIRYNIDDLVKAIPEMRKVVTGEGMLQEQVLADIDQIYARVQAARELPGSYLSKMAVAPIVPAAMAVGRKILGVGARHLAFKGATKGARKRVSSGAASTLSSSSNRSDISKYAEELAKEAGLRAGARLVGRAITSPFRKPKPLKEVVKDTAKNTVNTVKGVGRGIAEGAKSNYNLFDKTRKKHGIIRGARKVVGRQLVGKPARNVAKKALIGAGVIRGYKTYNRKINEANHVGSYSNRVDAAGGV